jgi:cyclopropane-fatty-acyl-phospholipid synthase
MLHRLAAVVHGAPLRLELWNGLSVQGTAAPVATIVINDRATLWRLLLRPALAFGEAYAAGRVTVDGDLVGALEAIARACEPRLAYAGAPPRSSRSRVHRDIHAHYDLGNDFYRLWLDDEMVYTCAYFAHEDDSLERAQRAKLDYVCRKLALRPGETVIEAGCGWGALAIHMAKHFGVSVRAFNISEPQLLYARERAAREGVADSVDFIQADWRDIDGGCDAFVSVGMLEHLGGDPGAYAWLGMLIHRALDRRHGRGLLHFIGQNRPEPFNPWILRHIFPGAYAPTLSEVLSELLERFDFSVTDVENLRLHYAKTLHHWRMRFEARRGEMVAKFDPAFVRMWRLYLAEAEAGFAAGTLQLYQIMFGRADDNSRARTRAGLYPPSAHDRL